MDKKIITIAVLLLILIGVSIFLFASNPSTVDIGSANFSVPDGYTFKEIKNNEATITQNNGQIKIKEVKANSSLQDFVVDYYDKYSENYTTIENSSYTVSDADVVYVLAGPDKKNNNHNHYWYSKNGKYFHVYIYGKTNKTAVDYIINSTN